MEGFYFTRRGKSYSLSLSCKNKVIEAIENIERKSRGETRNDDFLISRVQFVGGFLNLLIGGMRFNLNRVSFDFRIKIRPAARRNRREIERARCACVYINRIGNRINRFR